MVPSRKFFILFVFLCLSSAAMVSLFRFSICWKFECSELSNESVFVDYRNRVMLMLRISLFISMVTAQEMEITSVLSFLQMMKILMKDQV